jgi:hypothetical protein
VPLQKKVTDCPGLSSMSLHCHLQIYYPAYVTQNFLTDSIFLFYYFFSSDYLYLASSLPFEPSPYTELKSSHPPKSPCKDDHVSCDFGALQPCSAAKLFLPRLKEPSKKYKPFKVNLVFCDTQTELD